jgi:hypothetical protein
MFGHYRQLPNVAILGLTDGELRTEISRSQDGFSMDREQKENTKQRRSDDAYRRTKMAVHCDLGCWR